MGICFGSDCISEPDICVQAPVGLRKKSFSSRAKTEGRFIEQLFSMLSDQDQYGDVIRWEYVYILITPVDFERLNPVLTA